jgi:hypothetical protein
MKRRVFISKLVLLVAMIATSLVGDELKTTYQVAGQTITLELETRKFELGGRTLNYQSTKDGGRILLLEGVEVIGTDLMMPSENTREFSLFRVSWNGKDVPVEPELYLGFLNPHLKTQLLDSDYASLKIIVDPSGEWIQLLMFGSDGGGSYSACWLLRKDGKHKLCDPRVFEFSN